LERRRSRTRAPRVTAYEQVAGRGVERGERLLRLAQVFAAHSDPERLVADLLEEAVAIVGGDDGMVTTSDPTGRSVHRYSSHTKAPLVMRPPRAVSAQAAERRTPIIANDPQQIGSGEALGQKGPRAALAVPLLHEEHVLGALVVQSYASRKRFDSADARSLAVLAGIASAALVGLERARIEAVELAARTVEHEVINKLALTTGYVQLISNDASLPAHLRKAAAEALEAARSAVSILTKLQELTRLEKKAWGSQIQSTIDLEQSLGQGAERQATPG
jgi:GAF domain-containing protein